MCDICGEVYILLQEHDVRLKEQGGLFLNKAEILGVVNYVQIWQQRQCMCCYKDYKNFEKFNNVIQVILHRAIKLVQSLPKQQWREKEKQDAEKKSDQSADDKVAEKVPEETKGDESQKMEGVSEPATTEDGKIQSGDEKDSVEKVVETDPKDDEMKSDGSQKSETEGSGSVEQGDPSKDEEKTAIDAKEPIKEKSKEEEVDEEDCSWTLEDRDCLFMFVSKVFLMNFPLYIAYKHCIHSSLEELSQQEASALNNYCELSDPEIPVYLLRNVCFFCDSNGIASIAQCFDQSDPEVLPCMVAHTLITIVANLRLWMNIGTVMQNIVPIRGQIIRYMCRLSDKDLRMAGTRNMTDLMWAAIKEPIETQLIFDKEGLDLAFKYFTCSTLTIRLTGVTQINNQINLYNELANNDNLIEGEGIGKHMADWLIESRIIEHIFGPSLHVEIIKQSQMILNFLAIEGRITKEHMDCIWAAAQLKHCGRQVMDILIPLIKNLEYQPAQHLLHLVSGLDLSHHTEQTLLLASTVIKFLWNTAITQSQMCMQQHNLQANVKPIKKQESRMEPRGSVSPDIHRRHGLNIEPNYKLTRTIPGAMEEHMSDCESGHSSIGAHSDMSGYSSKRFLAHKRLKVRIEKKRALEQEQSSDSELEVDSSEESLEEDIKVDCGQVECAHDEIDESESESLDESEVDDDDDDEEINVTDDEVIKHLQVVKVKGRGHRVDDASYSSDSDRELGVKKRKCHRNDRSQFKQKLRPKSSQSPKEEYKHDVENCYKCQHGGHTMESEGITDLDTSGSLEMAHHVAVADSTADTLNTSSEGAMLHELDGHSSDGEVPLSAEEKAYLRLCSDKHGMDPEEIETYLEHIHAVATQERRHRHHHHHHHHHHQHQHQHHGRLSGEFIEDILSPDDHSNSSHISTKSEKNMADFEGEDMSEEDLTHISAQACFDAKGHQHSISSDVQPVHACIKFDEVCKSGNTLLWDLVQDDNVTKLPEGLYMEAEKVLSSLVCFATDRSIRTKFIEACVVNLASHRSVVVSLRLLPKIFASFQQYRAGIDTHNVTMWAEKDLHMTKNFFNDLDYYMKNRATETSALYSHKEEIQTRLQFLTCVFSMGGSPDSFRLSLDQVDTLWICLVENPECTDECFNWFLNQAKSKDQHAMGLDTFKHIFMEKMPKLKPESMSMTGLNLFTQLCQLAKMANASMENPLPEDQVHGMDQLWGIALRAQNTDVSLTAIQYLNAHYISYGSGGLDKEEEFVQRCMDSLLQASSEQLQQNPESALLVIQRALILLTNHLESFRKRYAFHLRMWKLDDQGIECHQKSLFDKNSVPLRVVLQPAGASEKTTVEMQSTDLVAELRAEVTRWWDGVQKAQQRRQQTQEEPETSGSVLTPILGAMLGDGLVRMITLGQELTVDMDEKTLAETQFKDMQFVFVSLGASRPPRKPDGSVSVSYLSPPDRSKLPMMLLLQESHFSRLFNLLQQLSNFKPCVSGVDHQELYSLQTKATVLSRKVWDLLMLLPTNSQILHKFLSISQGENEEVATDSVKWDDLLDADNPHKLMYSLQIVETLSNLVTAQRRKSTGDASIVQESGNSWSNKFIHRGGLTHLFNIFLRGGLQIKDDDHWNEWLQDCLACLLRLISQFSVSHNDQESQDDGPDTTEIGFRKRAKKMKGHKIIVPKLAENVVSELDAPAVVQILMTILYEAALPSVDFTKWPSQSWGRVEVMHFAISFLVSLAFTTEDAHPVICESDNFTEWLRRLILEAPEPPVRQEASQGLYRLCLGRSQEGDTGHSYLLPVLAHLVKSLDVALNVKSPQKMIQEDKDPYGPCCRDYFWLVCRLTDSINIDEAISTWEKEGSILDINLLTKRVSQCILDRPYLERRPHINEDHGLCGLIMLCATLMKLNPPYRESSEGQVFLVEVFNMLFALPSPETRYLPKCKSHASRSAAFDLLVEMVKGSLENYTVLHQKVLHQHNKESHSAYSWDQWPHEDERSQCGYVGLTNLGATCYMATCMQHLYMIPEARNAVLEAKCSVDNRHEPTLSELKKMFAYLLESERKAYNPRSFCKVYTMDHQPLNTGEQKDMTEFFTDLISKMEEMGPDLRKLVKNLFGGVITNNVVSLDCPHVSRNKEEFYTIRCQVADMKNLYDSLDEVTVKDMLEGDNMYTCSKCQKKVRAEKRACFKWLPKILCFNTMRYTFNMVTMMKEKVNTHFSFPVQLDMSSYMEKNLIGRDRLQADHTDCSDEEAETEDESQYHYELIGVTVHTGTADGGHYYSFIRDRLHKNQLDQDQWFLFNDAEVKPFDPGQIAYECFGGEMMRKSYDTVTEKFMDFSFEKTNSAYMLFYERLMSKPADEVARSTATSEETPMDQAVEDNDGIVQPKYTVELSSELEDWIWKDNMQFLQDKNIFEHTCFNFMWQMCCYIPTTLPRKDPEHNVPLMAAKLSASFVLESLIHAKEKPTMLQWIELVTKQFNACHAACEWFLDTMEEEDWWPQQILIKCPNQMVRQMFQRLVIHVINQLRATHHRLYLHPLTSDVYVDNDDVDVSRIGNKSCVTRFIKRLLSVIDHGTRPHCKYLNEYFAFLLEFARMGEHESMFLLQVNAISIMTRFFMAHKTQESYVEILSDDEEEEEDVITLSDNKYRPQALEKMITLIAMLVEKSRGDDNQLHLKRRDLNAILSGKPNFPFLFNQIRDHINLRQTCNIMFSICRWNNVLAKAIIDMIFGAITRLGNDSQPFFKILSMLVEFVGGPPGLPPFTHYILQKYWEVAEYCPHQCLDWLASQVSRNKYAHNWTLKNMNVWVEPFLLSNNNVRVRNSAAGLLINLVPSSHFRQTFRTSRNFLSPHKEPIPMTPDALEVLHDIYTHLLRLLPRARHYIDAQNHGSTKLVLYFAVMGYCLISRAEKLMFTHYFSDLWALFHPKMSEPPISMHHNKQALLMFWHHVCIDCPENVKLIVSNPNVTKNIAFIYILADHEDQDVVLFNRTMLPAYYAILRMCCMQSRSFTRQLAQHQNIQWAFKNITPYPTQYMAAVDELFRMMRLMVTRYPDSTEEELRGEAQFRVSTLQLYMQNIDARTSWQTLITALKILLDSNEDKVLVLQLQGLPMLHEAFNTLHMMHHEATACHVTGDIVDLLDIVSQILKAARGYIDKKKGAEVKPHLFSWKDRMDFARKLLSFLNSYTPPDVWKQSIDCLRDLALSYQSEFLQTIVPTLVQAHGHFQDNNVSINVGPYFPRRGQKNIPSMKTTVRPPRPQFQMFLHSSQLESDKGKDESYDAALLEFFTPYHAFVDLLLRVAVNQQNLTEQLINLSAMVAYESVPLHLPHFAKLWYEIYQTEQIDKSCIQMLTSCSPFIEYVDAVLLDERQSLNNQHIYQFFCNFFPKVYQQVLNDQGQSLYDSLISSVKNNREALDKCHSKESLQKLLSSINGDVRALLLIFSVHQHKELPETLTDCLRYMLEFTQSMQKKRQQSQSRIQAQRKTSASSSPDAESEEPIPAKRRRKSSEPSGDESSKTADTTKTPVKTAEPKPTTSKDTTESSETPTDIPTKATQKTPEPNSEGEEKPSDAKPEPAKYQGRRSGVPKEKPTLLDQVVKNLETIFKMMKK